MEGKTGILKINISIIVINHRKFKIQFKSESDPDLNWEFTPVNDELIVNAGETALTFYKAYNNEEKPVIGIFNICDFNLKALPLTKFFLKTRCSISVKCSAFAFTSKC